MAADGDFIVVHITAKDAAEARFLATLLLEKRKAACVNIVPHIISLYRWQDKIEDDSESLLIAKTTRSLLHDIIALVKENHSYEVPEIIATPLIGGSPEYLEWLRKEVEGG